MANVGGPVASKRRLLMSVINSILLYGCEVWVDRVPATSLRRLRSIQRVACLRICSAYRTVSEPAALVISGVVPIVLLALERKRIYNGGRNVPIKNEKVRTKVRKTRSAEDGQHD